MVQTQLITERLIPLFGYDVRPMAAKNFAVCPEFDCSLGYCFRGVFEYSACSTFVSTNRDFGIGSNISSIARVQYSSYMILKRANS